MISYAPFWETLKNSQESTYTLVNKYGISSSTIYRFRHGRPVSSETLNTLCHILDCRIDQLIEYIPHPDDQKTLKKKQGAEMV